MNPSVLGLIGALDAFIYFIESERGAFSNSFDIAGALRTLERAKAELRREALAFARVESSAHEAFESTRRLLVSHLPQGSPLESALNDFSVLVKSTTITYATRLSEVGEPSLSGSKSSLPPLGQETQRR